jgi:hypothetical protein
VLAQKRRHQYDTGGVALARPCVCVGIIVPSLISDASFVLRWRTGLEGCDDLGLV